MPGRVETSPTSETLVRRGVYLLTHPRSASNLFQTMLSKQPGFQNSSYKLFDPGFAALGQLERGPLSQWPKEDREALYNAFNQGFEALQAELEDARKNGNQALIKEHAILLSGPDKVFARIYSDDEVDPLVLHERNRPKLAHTNPTSLPDSLLLSMQPIFQIRHPILMFPSMLRAQSKALGPSRPRDLINTATMTLRQSRELFDWYDTRGTDVRPKVIDADDIMNDKEAVRKLCIETGLDPDAIQYEWEAREEKDPLKAAFLSTLYASKGILPGFSARGLDMDVEKSKWKAEFGEEDGDDLAILVMKAMPDYNYLWSRRTCSGREDRPHMDRPT
ncbi:hypothetical protein ACN47E_002680 [Coniothyrium glycines]